MSNGQAKQTKNYCVKISVLWYIPYCVFVFSRIILNTEFVYSNPSFTTLVIRLAHVLIIGCCLMKLVLEKRVNIKQFLLVIVLGIGVICSIVGNYEVILYSVILIIFSYKTDFKITIKCLIATQLFGLIFTFFMCKIGVIRDLIYMHLFSLTTSNGIRVHSFGFSYYTMPAYLILAIMMEYFFLRGKAKLIEIFVWGVIQYLTYRTFTSRGTFYMAILFIFLYTLFCYIPFGDKIKRFLLWFGRFGFFIMCLVNVILVRLSSIGNTKINSLNNLLNGRFDIVNKMILQYGIHLWPQQIIIRGAYEVFYTNSTEYSYIDSGYLYSLICYGVIFTITILFIYTIIYMNSYQNNNKLIMVWMLTYMIMNINNNMLFSLQYCPLLILLPQVLNKKQHNIMKIRIKIKNSYHNSTLLN